MKLFHLSPRIIKTVRQIMAFAVGMPLLGLGVFLIPLPGPGLLVMLLGLFILSLEFALAEKYYLAAKSKAHKLYKSIQEK